MPTDIVYHFSEDPNISLFAPHVPKTNPDQPAAVWAIDAEHSPLYWFPRDCPRVTAWARTEGERIEFERAFGTSAARVHAIESAWLAPLRDVTVYRYAFDASAFEAWPEAAGQLTSPHTMEPLAMEPIGDLLTLHAEADIELRVCPSLWPIYDLAVSEKWEFSIVRMSNAAPR